MSIAINTGILGYELFHNIRSELKQVVGFNIGLNSAEIKEISDLFNKQIEITTYGFNNLKNPTVEVINLAKLGALKGLVSGAALIGGVTAAKAFYSEMKEDNGDLNKAIIYAALATSCLFGTLVGHGFIVVK